MIGNLPSPRRNSPGSMAVLLLALLPIPPKFSKSSKADKRLSKINADTLQDVFELIFAPLQDMAHAGIAIDCVDGKVRQCFPILSAWIADHKENVALHGLKTNACPKCEVPTNELGTNAKNYRSRDYARYQRYKPENANSGSESDNDHVMSDNHQQKIFSLMYYIHISLYHLVIPSPPIPPKPLIFPSFSKGPWGFHASQNILLASLIRRLCPSLLAYSTRKGALHH